MAKKLAVKSKAKGVEDPLTALEKPQAFEVPVFMEAGFHGIKR